MQLKELASLFVNSRIVGDGNTAFTDIQFDSRKVGPGHLFICVPGYVTDGHRYAPAALAAGASALVTERVLDLPAAQLVVPNARYAMAVIASHFFGYPSHGMQVIGVTGTKGKTTMTYLLERILADRGWKTGLMGTIRTTVGGVTVKAERTTQEAPDLQRNLRLMADAGTQYVVMEASSEALEQERVKGTKFRTAIFTNLTQDHLNFHHTMDNYRAAKGLLFSRLGNTFSAVPEERQYAVLNADDEASDYFARLTSAQVIRYGIDRPCDVRATSIRMTLGGTVFTVESFAGSAEFRMQLVGKFNVYNALGAIAACLAEGIALDDIKDSLERVQGVSGRMERVDAGQPYLVLVDYAHTPDSLEKALTTIGEFAAGQVITVFGCGGDRDRTKRPIMGRVAAQYSGYVYVTSDNPRSEDPEAILRDILPGLAEAGLPEDRYEAIADRKIAIQKAIDRAGPGDVVLIAGKGHETYQEIQGVKYDFDDRLVAEEAIRRRGR
ncbi:UDP-N-acetylmuramoylalanyl-D-glutamate--2,6-diaminopimelate ligase [Gordoniibacillus kamchatkensis]|uniref:UDP-N-acetylmuramoyl-L-alanyl-D-glutamate--2,6-diaminopimelate ligase n=1 Tax=Gordoniibacillus kamchatkensis TaxID=1590651 RepID=A0ABR5AL47_9BACL|nr:UDP-N-acetylmuramoyl-L-alanyl-D-glutamate--2,6-diaminopimelate ligase [Paenibacillus sp. VKM B-2647]KIL41746.1 UDP-N-acetylmuramoylalanyl-D-glutamate--2,6-diaminopimelate ligase [Paenibacillus sp. VKM B-2647]